METDHTKKLMIHKVLSILITLVGIIVMIFMIIVESEPGAIPLLLVVLGAGWYFITRCRLQSQHT